MKVVHLEAGFGSVRLDLDIAEFEAGCDVNAATNTAVDRAPRCVMLVSPARGIALVLRTSLELVANPNPLDDQHPALYLDLALGF